MAPTPKRRRPSKHAPLTYEQITVLVSCTHCSFNVIANIDLAKRDEEQHGTERPGHVQTTSVGDFDVDLTPSRLVLPSGLLGVKIVFCARGARGRLSLSQEERHTFTAVFGPSASGFEWRVFKQVDGLSQKRVAVDKVWSWANEEDATRALWVTAARWAELEATQP